MFMITDPATGQVIDVYPEDTLNSRQCDKMLTHPDMILQFCHRLAEEMRQRGHGQVEVRAEVMASLNGRERQLLVDPTVDLAKEKRSLAPAPWIMPLTKPLPRPGSSPATADLNWPVIEPSAQSPTPVALSASVDICAPKRDKHPAIVFSGFLGVDFHQTEVALAFI